MADAAKEEPAKAEPSRFVTFWTSLPGVLTGVAAVVAAVVSLIALFHHDPSPIGAVAAGTPSSIAVPAAPSSPPVGSSALPAPSGVAGQGSLTVGVGEHVDLAAGVVADSASANRIHPQFFLSDSDGYALVADGARALVLTAAGTDRAGCLAAVTSHQAGRLPLTAAVGSQTVCVLTDGQQVAALTPTSMPAVGSPRFTFGYVLWS